MKDKIYHLKDEDKLVLTGKQLKEWKKLIINQYIRYKYKEVRARNDRKS